MKRLDLQTSWGGLRLIGGSRAGEGSLVLLPQLRLALDAGRAVRPLVPMEHVVLSHGHADHILGLAAWASQRQLQLLAGGTVYAPAAAAPAIRELLDLHARLEGGPPYGVSVKAVAPRDSLAIRRDFSLRFFATSHWTETLGCCVDWTRRRLRADLVGSPPAELEARRREGRPISEDFVVPLIAYAADTGPEVFAREPWLRDVEVLIVECTFLRPEDHDRAARYGHLHLDDLVEIAPLLANRHVVLTHLSRRHRLSEGAAKVRTAVGPRLSAALHFLNVEWP